MVVNPFVTKHFQPKGFVSLHKKQPSNVVHAGLKHDSLNSDTFWSTGVITYRDKLVRSTSIGIKINVTINLVESEVKLLVQKTVSYSYTVNVRQFK